MTMINSCDLEPDQPKGLLNLGSFYKDPADYTYYIALQYTESIKQGY